MIIRPEHPDKLVKFLKSKPLILYGMGETGKRIAAWCNEHKVDYLLSDKKAKELVENELTGVILPQQIAHKYKDANIVVSSIMYINEIIEDLLRLGISKERIFEPFMFMPSQVTLQDLEDGGYINWKRMDQRLEMVKLWGWIPEDVKSVVDYSAGNGLLLKKYLPKNVMYYPIDYVDRGENTTVCDFSKKQFPDIYAELSICFAMVMYTEAAEKLIDNICAHTGSLSIFTAITIEGLSDINIRRYSGMVKDLTEQQIIDQFFSNNFVLKDKRYHAAGNSIMTFFLFKKE